MPKSPVPPRDLTSLAHRISGAWDVLRGRAFGPGDPMTVHGTPDEQATGPRQFQYPVTVNRSLTPRSDYGLTPFQQLRALAANYDVAALCINARIEQMCGVPLTFVAKDKRQQRNLQDRCNEAEAFWASPDKFNDWQTWLSQVLYELFSTDAVSLYKRPDVAGRLFGLDPVDGATIKPLLDERGRTVAYQQVLYGLPMSDYRRAEADAPDEQLESFSRNELIYKPRWTRTFTPYGSPPTEWIVMRVNTALRKQSFDLGYFSDGNIPAGIATPPDGTIDPDTMRKFEEAFNATLDGNAARLNRIKFVPWKLDYKEFRQFSYDTKLDRWMLGITCAAYGISPQELGFVEDVNRANGEVQENINERRGLGPLKRWLKSIIDPITTNDLGLLGIEAQFGGGESEDHATQASTDKTYWDMGVISADEVRALRYGDVLDGNAPNDKRPSPDTTNAVSGPLPMVVGKLEKADDAEWMWSEREHYEHDAQHLIAAAYDAQYKRIKVRLEGDGADSLDDNFWATEQGLFVQAVLPLFDTTAQEGATIAADRLGIALDWTGLNPEILRCAREHAHSFAQTETDATKRAVTELVLEWTASGANFKVFLDRVAKVWPDQRFKAAGVTAVTRILSAAQRLAWEASEVVKGYRINTVMDSHVCPICQAKNRNEFSIRDTSGLPPLHWGCRCDIDPVVKGPDEL